MLPNPQNKLQGWIFVGNSWSCLARIWRILKLSGRVSIGFFWKLSIRFFHTFLRWKWLSSPNSQKVIGICNKPSKTSLVSFWKFFTHKKLIVSVTSHQSETVFDKGIETFYISQFRNCLVRFHQENCFLFTPVNFSTTEWSIFRGCSSFNVIVLYFKLYTYFKLKTDWHSPGKFRVQVK